MLDTSAMKAMETTHLISSLWARGSLSETEEELLVRLEFTYHELRHLLDVMQKVKTNTEEILEWAC